MDVGGLVDGRQVLDRQAALDRHPVGEPHPVPQAEQLDVGGDVVVVLGRARGWVARIAVEVKNDVRPIPREAIEDLQQPGQQLARLVPGVGQDDEAPLVAKSPFGGLPVGRRPEDGGIHAVGDVLRDDAVRECHVTPVLAHGDRDVDALQDPDPTRRQCPLAQVAVDRVVERPGNLGSPEEARDRRVGDVRQPPDVGQRDEDVGLEALQVAEQDVGAERVESRRVQGAAAPGLGLAAHLPANDGHVMTPFGEALADKPGDVAEAGRGGWAVGHPEDLHRRPA